jgi:hypothetical protein
VAETGKPLPFWYRERAGEVLAAERQEVLPDLVQIGKREWLGQVGLHKGVRLRFLNVEGIDA